MEPFRIKKLFAKLNKQPRIGFPKSRQRLQAPDTHGVYVIRNRRNRVMHVGRTQYGKSGLHQRLKNHVCGQSSFVQACLRGDATKLRNGYTYQLLSVPKARDRVLLEYLATVILNPKHLGVGKNRQRARDV